MDDDSEENAAHELGGSLGSLQKLSSNGSQMVLKLEMPPFEKFWLTQKQK
jgi:hypothetical protein